MDDPRAGPGRVFDTSPYDDHAELTRLRAECDALRAALLLAREAMRAPFDDWKGELERKALDAANIALAAAPRKEGEQAVSPNQENQ